MQGFEDIKWAGAQRPAGGCWKEEVEENGRRMLTVILVLPPRSAEERDSGVRWGSMLRGRVLEMSLVDPVTGKETVSMRVLGNVSSGMVTG